MTKTPLENTGQNPLKFNGAVARKRRAQKQMVESHLLLDGSAFHEIVGQ